MTPSKLSTRFVIFVVVSLMTHLLELAASGVFCHTLMQQKDLRMPWFTIAAGLLILPVVAIQLASAVCLLRRKGETSTSCEIATTAILHILQLGFISRHFIILRETSLSSKRQEIIDLMLLRASFAFTSGSTLLFVQVYLLLQGPHEETWVWAVYFSGITNLLSVAWAVSTSRKCLPDDEFSAVLITWPGSLLRMFWRAGELLARVIAAALFASLYIRFLFLVMALHWLSMLVCLYIPLITSIQWPPCGSLKKTLVRLMISFTHIFTFINTSVENSVFRYTFYYVIFFLENATLIAVWFVQSSSSEYFSRNSIFAYVAVIAFVTSLTSMIIYYKYVHIPVSKAGPVRNCKHAPSMTRSLADGTNCQSGFQQDGGSAGLAGATMSVCSCHQQQKQYFVPDIASKCEGCANTKQRNSRQNASSLSQSNTENTNSSMEEIDIKDGNKHKYTALELKISTAGVQTEPISYKMSQTQPVWLPSGDSNFANQLLTYTLDNFDAAETADSERSSDVTECGGYRGSRFSPAQDAVYERNSTGSVSNASHQTIQQRPSHAHTPETGLTSLYDSENVCMCACQCGSEMPPTEHDVTSTPGSETRTTRMIPQCFQADNNRRHHHFHHHHHRHTAVCKTISPAQAKDNLPGVDAASNTYRSTDAVQPAQESTSSIHPPLNPSPGCYKNKKRKHSQHGKLHISTVVDTFTALSTSTEQRSVDSNLAQDHICPTGTNLELSSAQNDQLAIELLKSSFNSENHAVSNNPDITTVSTSDPRFSVRVMTAPASENSTRVDVANSNTSNNIKDRLHDHVMILSELGSRKRQQTDNKRRKTISSGTCKLTDVITNPENESRSVNSYGVHDETRRHDITHTGIPKYLEDNIYENIWPTKGTNQLKSVTHWDNYSASVDTARRRSDRRDMCSESEDSALPMEFLSSSAEVFTASNSDSDISLEIVI